MLNAALARAARSTTARHLPGRSLPLARLRPVPVGLALLWAVACTAGSGASANSEAATATPLAASGGDARLRACIEEAGYDWDEVWPPWTSPERPPTGSPYGDAAFLDAFDACLGTSGLPEGSPFDEASIDQHNREILAYVECMRALGWQLSDPQPWEGWPHPGLLDPPALDELDVPEDDVARLHRDSAACGVPVLAPESGHVHP